MKVDEDGAVSAPKTGMPQQQGERRSKQDVILNVVLVLAILSVVVFAGYFAYEAYQTRQAQRAANPNFRVIEDVKKAVKASPNDAQARELLAEALASDRQFDAARREIQNALKLEPKYAAPYMLLAKISMIEEQYSEAINALNAVLKLTEDPQYQDVNSRREEAYFLLGEVALTQREYEDAIGYYKAAIRINRAAADSYLRLAQAFIGLDEIDAAKDNLNIALAFDPGFAEANYEIGRLYLADGDTMRAAEAFQAALQSSPDSDLAAEALAAIGDYRSFLSSATIEFTAGKYEPALVAARTARALAPDDLEVIVLEARILEKAGKPTDALDAWRDAVRLDSTNTEAKAAVSRLEAAAKKGGSQ